MTTENIVHNQPANLLKTALLGNAAFSMISGLLMVLAGRAISEMMGVPGTPVLFITGLDIIGKCHIQPGVEFMCFVDERLDGVPVQI